LFLDLALISAFLVTNSGGNALPFYDTIAVEVSKVNKSEERDSQNRIVSHQVRLKMTKNKAGSLPADPFEFRLWHDERGIDNDDELFGIALMNKLVGKVTANTYNFIKPESEYEDKKKKIYDPEVAVLDTSVGK